MQTLIGSLHIDSRHIKPQLCRLEIEHLLYVSCICLVKSCHSGLIIRAGFACVKFLQISGQL